MKNSKIGILIIIIIIIVLIFNFVFISPPQKGTEKSPEAKIDIKKITSGNIVISKGEVIYFSASNSSDKDGKIDSYLWDFDDGNSSTSVDPVHQYDSPGTYYVTLTVTDNDGKTNLTRIQITVINNKPVAEISVKNHPSPNTGKIPIYYTIQFNGNKSYDPDGEIVSWEWSFGDGNISHEENPKYTYEQTGHFTVTLTVSDDNSANATTSLELEIELRSYNVDWQLEQIEVDIEPNGYTLEGESTEQLVQIDHEYISNIDVVLNWTDRQPYLDDNETTGEDTFELNVLTPENISNIMNSSTGKIIMNFEYITHLTSQVYNAKTASDAINLAYSEAEFQDGGTGEWYFNVTALECKGGSWNNEIFDFDIGNIWSLKMIINYYTFEINEVTN